MKKLFARIRSLWSPELPETNANFHRLEAQLKERPKTTVLETDAALHESIMRAVRREGPSTRRGVSPVFRWAFGGAVAALLLACGMLYRDLNPRPPSPELRAEALAQLPDVWGLVAQTTATNRANLLPQCLTQPVRDLAKNMRDTADFFRASVP